MTINFRGHNIVPKKTQKKLMNVSHFFWVWIYLIFQKRKIGLTHIAPICTTCTHRVTVGIYLLSSPEVVIYKRKQESKKTRKKGRKQELIQESDQEKKNLFSFFLGRFLGRERVSFPFFLFSWSLSWSSSCFLVFFNKFPPQVFFNCIF